MRARPALRFWHRWFGILGGVWLLLLAVTGCAIAWYDELDSWLNPDLRRADIIAGPPASMDSVVANARAALPGFDPSNIILAPEPGRTHWLIGRQELPEGGAQQIQAFSDPATGELAGWRSSEAHGLNRENLIDTLYALHVDLLAGEVGVYIVGFVGIAWLIDHFLALPLAIPRRRDWRGAFRVKGRRGSLRRLWDWHRAKGMWLWLAGATLALTGVTLTFYEPTHHVVEVFSPVNGRLHERMPEVTPPENPIGFDRAMAAVEPDRTKIHSLRTFPWAGVYAVRTFDARDVDNQGRLWHYVSMADGSIVGRRHDAGSTGGDLFMALQYPLHSGQIAGGAGRIIVTLAGVATAALCITGWLLVWRRRRRRREPGAPA